jgi:carbonic anhydrase/acetyltransferase-like protein (isoleucine patch superfamily)
MTVILPFEGERPDIAPGVYLSPTASVIGRVRLAAGASVWYGAVLRGDVQPIEVGEATNIQDNAIVHASTGLVPAILGNQCTIGHAAIVHGCTLADRVLIGMGAILLDEAEVGSDTIVGAGALITARSKLPSGVLVMGKPAKVVRDLRPEEVDSIRVSAAHYMELAHKHARALSLGDP